jgi:ribonuclease HI
MIDLVLMADGASRGNPGLAACAYAIWEHEHLTITNNQIKNPIPPREIPISAKSFFLGKDTNNVAEWQGLIKGLDWIIKHYDPAEVNLQICLDSKLVIEQAKGNWKVRQPHLQPLQTTYLQMAKTIGVISYNHIYRPNNKFADNLCNDELDMREEYES